MLLLATTSQNAGAQKTGRRRHAVCEMWSVPAQSGHGVDIRWCARSDAARTSEPPPCPSRILLYADTARTPAVLRPPPFPGVWPDYSIRLGRVSSPDPRRSACRSLPARVAQLCFAIPEFSPSSYPRLANKSGDIRCPPIRSPLRHKCRPAVLRSSHIRWIHLAESAYGQK